MLIQHLMEEKQLNFDKPLLSVRRYTLGAAVKNDCKRKTDKPFPSIPRPPPYKSDMKSGPIRNPGTVPFLWEKIPGKPKGETKLENQLVERPPVTPKLPPGRALRVHQEGPDKASANPGVNKSQVEIICCGVPKALPVDEDIKRIGSFENAKKKEENPSLGDHHEAYFDALGTLSRTASLFLNCSISDLSGLDDPDSSTDPNSQDFMMGRFLPAAKAMASETPRRAPRKQPIVREQPRQLKKVVSEDMQPRLQYAANFVPGYSQRNDSRDNDCDEQHIIPAKVCGLLPCLGLKSSFCPLNPLYGISGRTRALVAPPCKTQATTSSSGSCVELNNKQYQLDMSEQRSVGGLQMIRPQVNRGDAKKDENPVKHCSYHGKCERISSFGRLVIDAVTSDHSGSVQSSEQKAARRICREAKNSEVTSFDLDKNSLPTLKELLADQNRSRDLAARISVVEKTLYVDTVHKLESLKLKMWSSNGKRQSDIKEDECRVLVKNIKQKPMSLEDIEKLSIADKATNLEPGMQKLGDFLVSSRNEEVNQDGRTLTMRSLEQSQELCKGTLILAGLQVPQEKSTQTHQPKVEKSGKYSDFPVPPPLPKSPSDSWLGRTLHTMSAKNASVLPYLGIGITSRHQVVKPKSFDAKWETIAKSTKQHQHLCFSKERLTPVAET